MFIRLKRQCADAWREGIDGCDFTRQCAAHVPMLVLLFGDRITHWVHNWSDLHTCKTRDLDAVVADMATRTRQICYGKSAHVLFVSLSMLSVDCSFSVAHAWLIDTLFSAVPATQTRVSELRDLLRHRLFPLLLRHCVLRPVAEQRRKRGRIDVSDAEWLLRATTCEDLFGCDSSAAQRTTPVFPLFDDVQVPYGSAMTTTGVRRQPGPGYAPCSFEQWTLYLPRLSERLLRFLAITQEHECDPQQRSQLQTLREWIRRDLAVGDAVTLTRVGSGDKHVVIDAITARDFVLNPQHDCAPCWAQRRTQLRCAQDACGANTLVAYTYHADRASDSRAPPAFAIRAFLCFCSKHTFPQLKRVTFFRPIVQRPQAHHRTCHWRDASGIDWLAMDPCGGNRNGNEPCAPRCATMRIFHTCCPVWNKTWSSATRRSFKLVASNAAFKTVAQSLQHATPIFHCGVTAWTNPSTAAAATTIGSATPRFFRMTPRTACVNDELIHIVEGRIAGDGGCSRRFLEKCKNAGVLLTTSTTTTTARATHKEDKEDQDQDQTPGDAGCLIEYSCLSLT